MQPLEAWRDRVDLPAYTVSEAAQYTRVSSQAVSRWFYGLRRPLLSPRSRGAGLPYRHLIEVAVVAAFRQKGLTLKQIRATKELLTAKIGYEYPFTQARLATDGVHVIAEAHNLGLPYDVRQVAYVDEPRGQWAFKDIIADRIAQFDYDGEEFVVRWYPLGRGIPLFVDPRFRFGQPNIRGVPTWVIRERFEAGDSIRYLEHDFELSEAEIMAALEFEGIQAAA